MVGELNALSLVRGNNVGFQCDLQLATETVIALTYIDVFGEKGCQEVRFVSNAQTIHVTRIFKQVA